MGSTFCLLSKNSLPILISVKLKGHYNVVFICKIYFELPPYLIKGATCLYRNDWRHDTQWPPQSPRSTMAPRLVYFGVRSRKLSNVGQSLDGWPKIYYLELLPASEGTLSRWSRLHLQSLARTNPHWARVVGYGSFSLCVLHKEGLCPSINRLMMMMTFNVCPHKRPMVGKVGRYSTSRYTLADRY
jgi:hypothetical protein